MIDYKEILMKEGNTMLDTEEDYSYVNVRKVTNKELQADIIRHLQQNHTEDLIKCLFGDYTNQQMMIVLDMRLSSRIPDTAGQNSLNGCNVEFKIKRVFADNDYYAHKDYYLLKAIAPRFTSEDYSKRYELVNSFFQQWVPADTAGLMHLYPLMIDETFVNAETLYSWVFSNLISISKLETRDFNEYITNGLFKELAVYIDHNYQSFHQSFLQKPDNIVSLLDLVAGSYYTVASNSEDQFITTIFKLLADKLINELFGRPAIHNSKIIDFISNYHVFIKQSLINSTKLHFNLPVQYLPQVLVAMQKDQKLKPNFINFVAETKNDIAMLVDSLMANSIMPDFLKQALNQHKVNIKLNDYCSEIDTWIKQLSPLVSLPAVKVIITNLQLLKE